MARKDTWTGSDQWIAERLAQASQYAGTAASFGEREAELRAEEDYESPAEDGSTRLSTTADYMLAQRKRYRALAIAALDDVLPFITKA